MIDVWFTDGPHKVFSPIIFRLSRDTCLMAKLHHHQDASFRSSHYKHPQPLREHLPHIPLSRWSTFWVKFPIRIMENAWCGLGKYSKDQYRILIFAFLCRIMSLYTHVCALMWSMNLRCRRGETKHERLTQNHFTCHL